MIKIGNIDKKKLQIYIVSVEYPDACPLQQSAGETGRPIEKDLHCPDEGSQNLQGNLLIQNNIF